MSLEAKLTDYLGGCFCALMEEQVCYCIKVEKHVKDLGKAKEELAAESEDILKKINEGERRGEESTEVARNWLKEVKEKEEAAINIKEEFDKMYTCLGCFAPNIWSRNRIGAKASNTLAELQTHKGKKPVSEVTIRRSPVAVEEMPLPHPLIGMEPYFNTAIGYLQDGGVRKIGIWGTAGVGKTTLLTAINNDFHPKKREQNVFDYVIFIQVSGDPTPEGLQKSIARRLEVIRPENATVISFAPDLLRLLKDKNFLLLLDDLQEYIDLGNIGIPHASSASGDQFKHCVVFTSRFRSVCTKMGAEKAIEMKGLDYSSALLLLRQRVGEDTINFDKGIEDYAKKIAKECVGLPPRDLISIGDNLNSKKSYRSWRNELNDLTHPRFANKGMDHPMILFLKSTYDGLEDDIARTCFLSCVFWPENFSIQKDELIECWIGLGLINKATNYSDYDQGHVLIDSLTEAGLLEPACSSRNQVRLPGRIRRLALQVADAFGNELTKWMVRAGNKLMKAPDSSDDAEKWGIAKHISLMHSEISALPKRRLSCPNLQTLVLKGNPPLETIPNCFFLGMPVLTFLDLSNTGIKSLPGEIGSLVELRYLNLSRTKITSLPKSLARLEKLKHLLLCKTRQLKKIPPGLLSNLKKLCVLDLTESGYAYYCKGDAPKERQRGGRPSITELNCFNREGFRSLGITIVSLGALRWLSGLPSLPISRLWIIKLEGLDRPQKLLSLDFLGSSNMRDSMKELTLMRCASLEELEIVASGDTSLSKLEILRLLYLENLNKISWSGFSPCSSLTGLCQLTIYRCGKLKHVTWVLNLQHLEYLNLKDCKEMEQVINQEENGTGAEMNSRDCPIPAFRSFQVRSLVLDNLPMLENICDSVFDFPFLESIEVSGCPELKKLPFKTNGKLRVISCEMGWWEGLDWEDKNIKSSLHSLVKDIPSIPVLPTIPPPQPPRPLTLLRDPSTWVALIRASFPLLFFIFCRVLPFPFVLCCILVLSIKISEWGSPEMPEEERNPKAMFDALAYLKESNHWIWKAVEEEEKYLPDDALEWQEDLTR